MPKQEHKLTVYVPADKLVAGSLILSGIVLMGPKDAPVAGVPLPGKRVLPGDSITISIRETP